MTLISPTAKQRFVDSNGNALSGGKLFTYAAGTTTKQNTFTDSTGGTPNANPIILDSRGEANVWLTTNQSYKFVLSPSTDTDPPTNPIWTVDQINASNAVTQVNGVAFPSSPAVNSVPVVTSTNTITYEALPNSAMAAMATNTIKGNNTNSSAAPSDLTAAQTIAILALTGNFRGWLAGMILSNDGTSPNTVLDISAGVCIDSTNTISIGLAAFTKSTGGSWVAGTGNNGMGQGLTIANSTWYHVFAAIISGVADVFFDTSVTAANAPAGTTAFRRIGSFRTDGSAHILAFTQFGDWFLWKVMTADASAVAESLTAANVTLTVPTGVNVMAKVGIFHNPTVAASRFWAYSPSITDAAASTDGHAVTATPTTAGTSSAVTTEIWTNASSQIRVVSDVNTGTYSIGTHGWMDYRGKQN